MRKFALLILTLSALQANAQFPTDPRSDSLDILKQHIKLNITDFTNRIISGSCDIRFKAITNTVQGITLDLHEFTVDSVTSGNQQLSFSYAANLLHIPFQTAMNNGDSTDISVWYHGEASRVPVAGADFTGIKALLLIWA
jgi:aminopeptidase N